MLSLDPSQPSAFAVGMLKKKRMIRSAKRDVDHYALDMIARGRQNDHIDPAPGDFGLRIRAEVDVASLNLALP